MSLEFLNAFGRVIAPASDNISLVGLDYTYLAVSDACVERHGRKREEMVGLKVAELVGEECFRLVMKGCLDRCFAGETVNGREWFEFKTAGRLFMDVTFYPFMPEGAIAGAVVIARDITPQRMAEERLRESEEKYRHLFESLNDAAFLADCASGLLVETNRMGEKLLGMTRDEIIGMHQSRFHPPCKAEEYRAKFADHIARGKAADYEGEVIRKDGRIVPVHISAAPVTIGDKRLILGIFRDITARKEVERALLESKRFAEGIIASMQDGFAVFDPEMRFLDGNPAFFGMVGFSREELAGLRPPYPFCARTESGCVAEAFGGLRNGVRKDRELAFLRKDGTVFPVILSPSQLTDGFGEIKNYFVIVKDITVRKKMEAEMLKAANLQSLGKLSGGLAHEFNNLLTVMLSNISIARMRGPEGFSSENLEVAEMACLKARDVMRKLLAFAGKGKPSREAVDLAALVAAFGGPVAAVAGVTCATSIEEGLPQVNADGQMLAEALRNIVANAAEAMPGGGVVRVTARSAASGGDRSERGPFVEIEVEDNGTGMDGKEIARIFDPYFTTKFGSSGLGLSVAYSVIEYHGGAIDVRSTPGLGTVVTVRLPVFSSSGGQWPGAPGLVRRQGE